MDYFACKDCEKWKSVPNNSKKLQWFKPALHLTQDTAFTWKVSLKIPKAAKPNTKKKSYGVTKLRFLTT